MIVAHKESALAVVVVRSERFYSICTYADETAFRFSTPTSTLSFVGEPNATDILSSLPDGWIIEPDVPLYPSPPKTVTSWQIRRWLLANGHSLADVSAAIAAIPDAALRESVMVDWEYAPYVERSHPMLAPLATALGIEDLDRAFIEAEQIK
jgi:hypothetical protein